MRLNMIAVVVRVDERCGGNKDAQARPTTYFRACRKTFPRMSPSDPYPVLKMLQSHLEGRLRLGQKRLWLEPGAAESLREMVRMKPRPRPASEMPAAAPSAAPALPAAPLEIGGFPKAVAQSVIEPISEVLKAESAPDVPGGEFVGIPSKISALPEAALASAPEAATPASETVATAPPTEISSAPPAAAGAPVAAPVPVREIPAARPAASEAPQRLTLPEAPEVNLTLREKSDRLAALRRRVEAKAAMGGGGGSVVFSDGSPDAAIAVVGEAPGGEEEWQGVPYVGPAGQLLAKVLKVMNLDRTKVYLTNVRKQRPAQMDTPVSAEEMDWLREEMVIVRPRVIVVLGGGAIAGLLGLPADAEAARGRFYDFEGWPVMATLDPVTLLAAEGSGVVVANAEKRKLWEDMIQVMERAGMPVSAKQRAFFLPK